MQFFFQFFFFFGNPFTFLQDIIRIFETFVNSKLKLDNIFLENQFIIDIYKRPRLDMNRPFLIDNKKKNFKKNLVDCMIFIAFYVKKKCNQRLLNDQKK